MAHRINQRPNATSVQAVVFNYRDITAREKAEEALGEMASGIVHDFNNALSTGTATERRGYNRCSGNVPATSGQRSPRFSKITGPPHLPVTMTSRRPWPNMSPTQRFRPEPMPSS